MGLVKAKLSDNKDHELEVQFNPETLSIEHQTFGEDSRKRPGDQSARGGADEAGQSAVKTGYSTSITSVTLLFDTSDSGQNVRDYTLVIADMMKPDKNVAPVVTFQWGSLVFKVTITGFTEELTYFSDQGVPLRARVNLRMTEAPAERAANNITSQNSGWALPPRPRSALPLGLRRDFRPVRQPVFPAVFPAAYRVGRPSAHPCRPASTQGHPSAPRRCPFPRAASRCRQCLPRPASTGRSWPKPMISTTRACCRQARP